MRKVFAALVVVLLGVAGGIYVLGLKETGSYVALKATFRMGGAVYKEYQLEGDTLVFKFERNGDFFTQAIETKEFSTDEKFAPKKVIMEVNTNGQIKRYEAKLVKEEEDRLIYEVSEL
ncbi:MULTISPECIES: hypothetical protein [Thermococcus]|uniref:Uncharacterized protein n=1 Tax=Thermococcus sibiricus (strain DSM 12597 / MM 739) TaxID=604354 RepID=C6A558_THESM|nr:MULTISPECIES: hypothetical protein [Thermococcus]ACS90753.1 hypothetical protein TSIB_1702 [Thermococcus sibiricus MM 739]MBC7094224.1 hypothetical protein [Thermococcus sp.]